MAAKAQISSSDLEPLELYDTGFMLCPLQEDPTKAEPRMAMVIQQTSDKFTVVPLTSQLHQKDRYANSFEIDKESDEGKEMNLSSNSLVMLPDRAFEISKENCRGIKKGKVPTSLVVKVLERL